MAPHRAMTPYLLEAPEKAGAVVLGLSSLIPLLGPHGLELVVWILVIMGVDLAAGLLRALVLPDEVEMVDGGKFARGVFKKFAILCVLPVAAMVDRITQLSGLIAENIGPVVFATAIGILMYEGASIVKNVQQTIGRAAFLARLLRTVDEFKAFPESPPERRSYDRVAKDGGDDA